jgi:broad specificity phosphatase PhoE
MLLYLVPTPENKLERQHREAGWRHVPIDREARKELRERVQRLKGKEITYVCGSDLDAEAVNVAAAELSCPERTDFRLRRFNIGRHHAAPNGKLDLVFTEWNTKWKYNPDIPLRGGDSLTSYRKRFVGYLAKLMEQKGSAVLVTDPRTIQMISKSFDPQALVKNGLERGKIYVYSTEPTA